MLHRQCRNIYKSKMLQGWCTAEIFCITDKQTCITFEGKALRQRENIYRGAQMADVVSALPFTTEFQVKPGRTGL